MFERFGRFTPRSWRVTSAVLAVAAITGTASGLHASEGGGEVYRYKCHFSGMGCVNGSHVFCGGGCGPKGCKCTSYDAMA